MVVYFRGLPKNEQWLRVDVERHMEGIPRNALRDYVGLKRAKYSEKTLEFVSKASHTTNLHGHNLNVAENMEAIVKPSAFAIPDNPLPV